MGNKATIKYKQINTKWCISGWQMTQRICDDFVVVTSARSAAKLIVVCIRSCIISARAVGTRRRRRLCRGSPTGRLIDDHHTAQRIEHRIGRGVSCWEHSTHLRKGRTQIELLVGPVDGLRLLFSEQHRRRYSVVAVVLTHPFVIVRQVQIALVVEAELWLLALLINFDLLHRNFADEKFWKWIRIISAISYTFLM